MLRRFVASAAVMFVITGFMLAGEYTGLITKIDKSEVTFKTKGKKGEEKTLKVKSPKITKGEDEVKAEDFAKMVSDAASGTGKRKGVPATITTTGEGDAEVVTKIAVRAKKKPE